MRLLKRVLSKIDILILFVLITIPLSGQDKEITRYFKKIKTIRLSNNIVIGEIAHLDIDQKGNLIVVDFIGKSVILFNNDGKFIKKLNADNCYPGFNFSPINAKFSPSGSIFMTNSAPWGLRFKNNGDCLGKVDKYFLAPINFCFDRSGNLYGYFLANDGCYISKMDSVGKELLRIKADSKFKNLATRLEGGGILSDENNFVYIANSVEPQIYIYNQQLSLITVVNHVPSYYQAIESDANSYIRDPLATMKDISSKMKGKTVTQSLFLLDKNKLIVQYWLGKQYGVEILDLKGNSLNAETYSSRPFILAKNGYAYMIYQPGFGKNGNLPNPQIEVYQFITSTK